MSCTECIHRKKKETESPCNICRDNSFLPLDKRITLQYQFQPIEHHGIQCLFCNEKTCFDNCPLDKDKD
jgi:hypothetical protein